MDYTDDPKFWEWLKEKERKEKSDQEFEQIPLYISVEIPNPKKAPENESIDTAIDYTIDSIVFEF